AASTVFEALRQPLVARRFALDAEDLDTLHGWIERAAIRWGIDGAHRACFDVPPTARYTFADGLDRLYLGYALPEAPTQPLYDRLPAGNVEGSGAAALGGFDAFMRALERLHGALAQARTPTGWCETLLDAIDTFLAARYDDIDDIHETTAALTRLCDDMT